MRLRGTVIIKRRREGRPCDSFTIFALGSLGAGRRQTIKQEIIRFISSPLYPRINNVNFLFVSLYGSEIRNMHKTRRLLSLLSRIKKLVRRKIYP